MTGHAGQVFPRSPLFLAQTSQKHMRGSKRFFNFPQIKNLRYSQDISDFSCSKLWHGYLRTSIRTISSPASIDRYQWEFGCRNRWQTLPFGHHGMTTVATVEPELDQLLLSNRKKRSKAGKDIIRENLELSSVPVLTDSIADLCTDGDSMLGRFALESSTMVDQLHGKSARNRLVQTYQKLLFEEKQKEKTLENQLKSNIPCKGCGALIQAEDAGVPGFAPLDVFWQLQKDACFQSEAQCLRCYSLETYKVALSLTVPDHTFQALVEDHVISNLRCQPKAQNAIQKENEKVGVLLMVVIDALDPEGSITNGLVDIIQNVESSVPIDLEKKGKYGRGGVKVVLVVNKMDLIPKDDPNSLSRWRNSYTNLFRKKTGLDGRCHVDTHLVSAKTLFGIEELVTETWAKWGRKGDLYVVGTSNGGKSTLFNALMRSDLCWPPISATHSPPAATVSNWPGTTLNLIKFPLHLPSDFKIKFRSRRLARYRKLLGMETEEQSELTTWDQAELKGHVKTSFEEFAMSPGERRWRRHEKLKGFDSRTLVTYEGDGQGGFQEWKAPSYQDNSLSSLAPSDNIKPSITNRWVFDTPGIINTSQLINYLTKAELDQVLPNGLIRPHFLSLRPGKSLIISGLIQIDCVSIDANKPVYLCVMASQNLPLRVDMTWRATRLRTREEMTCQSKKQNTRVIPFILPGDNPDRLGSDSCRPHLEILGPWPKDVMTEDEIGSDTTLSPLMSKDSASNADKDVLAIKPKGCFESDNSSSSLSTYCSSNESSSNTSPSHLPSSSQPSRPRPLPQFVSESFDIPGSKTDPRWFEHSVAEISLSSIGFAAVAAPGPAVLRVSSFGGRNVGVLLRDTLLVPDIFKLRGKRAGPNGRVVEIIEGEEVKHWLPFFTCKDPII